MCRSVSIGSIQLDHIDWFEDTMQISFSQAKKDQECESSRHARHLYADQNMLEVCCALEIYMAKHQKSSEGLQRFLGGNQPSRFLKAFTHS